jgi:hypothetical protein
VFGNQRSSMQRTNHNDSQERLSMFEGYQRSRASLCQTNMSLDRTIETYAPKHKSPRNLSPKLTTEELQQREQKKKQSVKD